MKQLKVFLIFLILTLRSTGVSQADILFSNFGASDTYDVFNGWNVNGQNIGSQESAMGFMPSETAHLSSIDFVISVLPPGVNEVMLSLVNDSIGAPLGALLESWTFTNQMGIFNNNNPIITANSILNPLLQSGTTYWLVASPPSPDTEAVWNWNSIQDTGPTSFSFDGGFTWGSAIDPQTRGVFRVNSTSAAVPEPSTLLLLGAGLAGVGILRRRFKK